MGGAITHLAYLHGFRSSPLSNKSRQTAAWVAASRPDVTWWCPQLPASPGAAMALLDERLRTWPAGRFAVIGSSLGGYYATALAERFDCPAALLNPAIDPARDLAKYIGELPSWHSEERIFFRAEYIDELRAMRPAELSRVERYFALIAKGDEVLDWREMTARYEGCTIKLLEGGDHALSDYAEHLGDVVDFLGLAP